MITELLESMKKTDYFACLKCFLQLSEPFKIFEFDFWRRPESHREINLCVKATHDGTVHAVISW